jgi:hypothetical protein
MLRGVGILGGVGAFLLLIAGPEPRRATRWAWFWLLYIGRSSGLGVLAFLLLGALRRRQRGEPAPPRTGARERIDGWQGFAIAFIGGLVVLVMGALLQDYLVPDRSGSTPYTYDSSASPR